MAQIYYMAQVNGLKYSVADWCFLKGADPFKYYSGLKAGTMNAP